MTKTVYSRAQETENCQSIQSFLTAFMEFVDSSSAGFTEFSEQRFWYFSFTIVKEFSVLLFPNTDAAL